MKRRSIFVAVTFLLLVLLFEGGARLAYLFLFATNYSSTSTLSLTSTLAVERFPGAAAQEVPRSLASEVLHPYLGYVKDQRQRSPDRHGFYDDRNAILRRRPGRLTVAVFGGSVAYHMHEPIRVALEELLARRDPTVEVQLANFAVGGYKQPQQVIALSYMLTLGSEPDVVINIDGFNEVVLSVFENYDTGIYPFFPRRWALRVQRNASLELLGRIGEVRYLRNVQSRDLRRARRRPMAFSALYGLPWAVRIRGLENDIVAAERELQTLDTGDRFEALGPLVEYQDRDALFRDVADAWRRSSLLMSELTEGSGGAYFHFLQPSQYLPGSKQLSHEERATAYSEGSDWQTGVLEAYPLLQERGAMLQRSGVAFFDATAIFASNQDSIYVDECCHFNDLGKKIFARYIVDAVAEHLPRQEAQGR